MSEQENFADWKHQSNSVNPWLAWQARADLAAERERWLVALLTEARSLIYAVNGPHCALKLTPRSTRRRWNE